MNHRHTLIPPCAAGDLCPGSENDAECVISRIEDADGGIVTLRAFRVFPGITLIYRDVDTRGRIVPPERSGTVFTIEHCLEGQIGFETGSGVCCLSPGDLSILSASDIRGVYFPGESCHGISIEIDTAETPRCLSCFLEDVKVDPAGLMRGFTENGGSYTARSDAAIAHIFSELYSVPESIRRGYFKVKILELLLFLSTVPSLSDSIHPRAATRSQAAMADSMSAYISEHLDERVTIDMLSREFHVSPTQIKTGFRAVYGVSFGRFARDMKMRAAAGLLRSTEHTVLEIAGMVGYDNASKFAKAFRDSTGMSPNEYRSADVPTGA